MTNKKCYTNERHYHIIVVLYSKKITLTLRKSRKDKLSEDPASLSILWKAHCHLLIQSFVFSSICSVHFIFQRPMNFLQGSAKRNRITIFSKATCKCTCLHFFERDSFGNVLYFIFLMFSFLFILIPV